MANGAGVGFPEVFRLNALDIEMKGCSSIADRELGWAHVLHNEDAPHELARYGATVGRFYISGSRFFAFVYPGELPGQAFSWNKHGLFVSVNYVPPCAVRETTFPNSFVARSIIEQATPKHVIRTLRSSPANTGFHYYVAQGRQLYSIEQSGSRTSCIPVKHRNIHTNHLYHGRFAAHAIASQGSLCRLSTMRQLLNRNVSSFRVLFDKSNRLHPIHCGTTNDDVTLLTVSFDALRGEVRVWGRSDRRPLKVFLLNRT